VAQILMQYDDRVLGKWCDKFQGKWFWIIFDRNSDANMKKK
jgi:hypothetical protein